MGQTLSLKVGIMYGSTFEFPVTHPYQKRNKTKQKLLKEPSPPHCRVCEQLDETHVKNLLSI